MTRRPLSERLNQHEKRGRHGAEPALHKRLEQFRAQRLDEPSNTLRAIDILRLSASRRLRSPVAEDVAESLKDWKRWAESYLKSQV